MISPKLENLISGGVVMKAKKTSWIVAGLGAAVTGLGAKAFKGRFGAGIVGFGLAHIALGLLDMMRPAVRD